MSASRFQLALLTLVFPVAASHCTAADLNWIQISDDGKGFRLAESGKQFVPWGFNYDHEGDGKLLEDYWDDKWPTVESAFREMKGLGANVVRIHIQFGKFMESPTKPRQHSLEQLARLLRLAEQTELYIDLTGLGCYHKQDVPEWYDKPVIIEETFVLKCGADELEEFIDRSQQYATGWIGFYWGKTPDEIRPAKTIPEAFTLSWLELFQKKRNQILGHAFLANGVTAHRGNSGEFPENTLPAFQSGIDVGADWIELDIFRTKDGQLVVTHDRTTKRVGNQDVVVAEVTYEELAKVNVATDFRRRSGKTVDECPPQRIPLLKDVLLLVMKQDRTRVSIQPKMDCVAETVALVKSMKAERWVGFNDGNLEYMTKVTRLAPDIPVFWDRGKDTNIDHDIRIAKQYGFEAIVLHHEGVTPDKVQKIKAAGIKVGAWTVNDRAAMEKLLLVGVERIYTDHPRLLLSLRSK